MDLNTFFTSPLGATIIGGIFTLIAGAIALYLYRRQRADKKRDSAKSIYFEIVRTEEKINQVKYIKSQGDAALASMDANKYLLSKSNWNDIKYLFVNDFSPNEWEILNNFYEEREYLNKSLAEIANITQVNIKSRTEALHNRLSELAVKYSDDISKINLSNENDVTKKKEMDTTLQKHNRIVEEFKSSFIDSPLFQYQYGAKGTFLFITNYLDLINTNMSTSSIGLKLKKIANIK